MYEDNCALPRHRRMRWPLIGAIALATAACATRRRDRRPSRRPWRPWRAPAGAATDDPFAPLQHGLRPNRLRADEALPRWSLQERMAHYHIPGVAIAVLRGGKVVAARGFGLREAGTSDAVDADTLFSVGSGQQGRCCDDGCASSPTDVSISIAT